MNLRKKKLNAKYHVYISTLARNLRCFIGRSDALYISRKHTFEHFSINSFKGILRAKGFPLNCRYPKHGKKEKKRGKTEEKR